MNNWDFLVSELSTLFAGPKAKAGWVLCDGCGALVDPDTPEHVCGVDTPSLKDLPGAKTTSKYGRAQGYSVQ